MMIFGQNLVAFKLPIEVDIDRLKYESKELEAFYLSHNMHIGGTNWLGAPLKCPLGQHMLTDANFFRHLPEMENTGDGRDKSKRLEYMNQWQWTELCSYAPYSTELALSLEPLGSFLNAVRMLKIEGQSQIEWHRDNTPGKEFRISVGISGMEEEDWMIRTGYEEELKLPMKSGEVWMIDIALQHRVVNHSKNPRYRLALQFYAPVSDAFLDLYKSSPSENVYFAKQYSYDSPFREL